MGTENTVVVKLTAATVIDGQIHRAGTRVELVESEAKLLLRLGKAELDTTATKAPAADAAAQAAAAQAAAEAAKAAPAPAAGAGGVEKVVQAPVKGKA
jgi:hypothetical protein